jgi:hypothetical protein
MSARCSRCLPGIYLCPLGLALWQAWLDSGEPAAWAAYSEHLGVSEREGRDECRQLQPSAHVPGATLAESRPISHRASARLTTRR